jgi:predicted nucleic-acid-binding protein
MLAVDTNIHVRYLTRDHADQAVRAKRLIDDNDVFVAATVLLEAEWVLRSLYKLTPIEIVQALADFVALPRVTVEDPAAAAKALAWTAAGMDFADALHLARTQHCEAFVSFDRRLASAARSVGAPAVRAP